MTNKSKWYGMFKKIDYKYILVNDYGVDVGAGDNLTYIYLLAKKVSGIHGRVWIYNKWNDEIVFGVDESHGRIK